MNKYLTKAAEIIERDSLEKEAGVLRSAGNLLHDTGRVMQKHLGMPTFGKLPSSIGVRLRRMSGTKINPTGHKLPSPPSETPKQGMSTGMKLGLMGAGGVGLGLAAAHLSRGSDDQTYTHQY